jgi:hypothetical protein
MRGRERARRIVNGLFGSGTARTVIYFLMVVGIGFALWPFHHEANANAATAVRDWRQLCNTIWSEHEREPKTPARRVWDLFSLKERMLVSGVALSQESTTDRRQVRALGKALDRLTDRRDFYDPGYFPVGSRADKAFGSLLNAQYFLGDRSLRRLNFALLADCVPGAVAMDVVGSGNGRARWFETLSFLLALIPFVLTAISLEIAVRHIQGLTKVESLIGDTFGLSSYIEEASRIYQESQCERIVTSLRHWVAKKPLSERISAGLRNCDATAIVFLGTIEWDVYFPGVMWRLSMLRGLKKGGALRAAQKVVVLHVPKDIPTFVVSKRSGQQPGSSDRGSLLIGNPHPSNPSKLYGMNLGTRYPREVDHYNFLVDTLICPDPRLNQGNVLTLLEQVTGVHPYSGIDAVLRIVRDLRIPFGTNGLVYSEYTASSVEDLCAQVANQMAGRLMLLAKPPDAGEATFLLDVKEIEATASQFLSDLVAARILEMEAVAGGGERRLRLTQAIQAGTWPTCDAFFA